MTRADLVALLRAEGLTLAVSLFDGGYTYRVAGLPGGRWVTRTAYWGDPDPWADLWADVLAALGRA